MLPWCSSAASGHVFCSVLRSSLYANVCREDAIDFGDKSNSLVPHPLSLSLPVLHFLSHAVSASVLFIQLGSVQVLFWFQTAKEANVCKPAITDGSSGDKGTICMRAIKDITPGTFFTFTYSLKDLSFKLVSLNQKGELLHVSFRSLAEAWMTYRGCVVEFFTAFFRVDAVFVDVSFAVTRMQTARRDCLKLYF